MRQQPSLSGPRTSPCHTRSDARSDAVPVGFFPLELRSLPDPSRAAPRSGVRIVESLPHAQIEIFATDTHAAVKRTPREPQCYAPLRPVPRVRAAVDAQVKSSRGRFVAVHIRRTDLWTVVPPTSQTADSDFERFVVEHAPSPVYLATDNAETQRAFREKYGARALIGREIGRRKGLRQTRLFDAAVDIFSCAAADVFKGSYSSSFSDTIAHLRNVSGRTHRADEHVLAP